MRVAVTGAAGLLGVHVVQELARRHEVIAADRREIAHPGVEFRACDLLDLESLEKAFEGADAVVHLAAIPNPDHAPARVVFETNVMGTHNALEAAVASGARRFINTSSDCVYGIVFAKERRLPDYLPLDENHPLRPEDAYGLSKMLAEESCRSFSRRGAIETVTFRPTWVWNEQVCKSHQYLLHRSGNKGRNFWSFIDVRDAAEAYRLALEAEVLPHDVYLLSADHTSDVLPTRELLSKCYPEMTLGNYAGGREVPEFGALLDTTRLKRDLGWQPVYDWPGWSALPRPD